MHYQQHRQLQRVRGRMNMPWWNQFRYWIFLKRNRNISCIISQHFLQMLPGKMFSEYSNISIVRCFFRKNIPHIHTCQEYLKVEYSLLCRIFQSSLFHLCWKARFTWERFWIRNGGLLKMDIVHSLITELPKKHYYTGSLLEHPDQVRRWQQSDLSQSCQK